MDLMKNLAKGGIYAAILIGVGVFVYFSVSDFLAGKTFRDEYRANNERIEQQQLEYAETQQRIMASIDELEQGIDTVIDRVGVIEDGVDQLKGFNRELKDGSVETGILSDRNDRLLEELKSRITEVTTEQ